MSAAPWRVVLAAAAIGAAAGVAGSAWASRVQRVSSGRAEWFRRLQWAWELTGPDDMQRAAAGMSVMDYVAESADRRDASMMLAIAPIMREIGQLVDENLDPSVDVDMDRTVEDTEENGAGEDGDSDGERSTSR